MRETTNRQRNKLKAELDSTRQLMMEQEDRMKSLIVLAANTISKESHAAKSPAKHLYTSQESVQKNHTAPHKTPATYFKPPPTKSRSSAVKGKSKNITSPHQSPSRSSSSRERSPEKRSYSPRDNDEKNGMQGDEDSCSLTTLMREQRWRRSKARDNKEDDNDGWIVPGGEKYLGGGNNYRNGRGRSSRRRVRVISSSRKWVSENNLHDPDVLDEEEDVSSRIQRYEAINDEYRRTQPQEDEEKYKQMDDGKEERLSEALVKGDMLYGKGFARDLDLDYLFRSPAAKNHHDRTSVKKDDMLCDDFLDGLGASREDIWSNIDDVDRVSSSQSDIRLSDGEDGELVIESKFRNSYREMIQRRKSVH